MQAIEQLLTEINKNPYLAVPLMIWTMVWKGLAFWFIALLVLNTLGLVEILYYFVLSGRVNLLQRFGPRKQKD